MTVKLLRLKITDPKGFRSIQPGFEYCFRHPTAAQDETDFAPFVCAGPNGSGKSNVLEALAAIFYHLECMYLDILPKIFDYDPRTNQPGFLSENATPDGFELEYITRKQDIWHVTNNTQQAHVLICKEPGTTPQWFVLNEELNGQHDETLQTKSVNGQAARKILPQYVLAYSSGENEILSLPFFKMRFVQYDECWQSLTQQMGYPGRPESRMVYLDSSFSQAILLCNLLYSGSKEGIKIFQSEVGIEELKEFRIIIRRHVSVSAEKINEFYIAGVFSENGLENLVRTHPALQHNEYLDGKEIYTADIIQLLDGDIKSDKIIPRLKRCATCWYEDESTGTLYLDYHVDKATRDAFAVNFAFDIHESPIELFHAFQVLLTLNLYSVSDSLKADIYQSDSHYVSETVPTLASDERVMRFKFVKFKKTGIDEPVMLKALSDGEHQLLHSLGLCMLFKNTDSLFLLDEPETHFNPLWRSQFISHLKKCLPPIETRFTAGISRCGDPLASYHCPSEMLITTHTPFLISDSQPDKVLVFKKEQGKVTVSNPEYNTFGASINKITMLTFGQTSTIGGQAADKLQSFREQVQDGADKQQLIDKLDKTLGESIEKSFLMKEVLHSTGGQG